MTLNDTSCRIIRNNHASFKNLYMLKSVQLFFFDEVVARRNTFTLNFLRPIVINADGKL